MSSRVNRKRVVLFVCLGFLMTSSISCEKIKTQMHYSQAMQAHNNGQFKKAIAAYEQYLALRPDDVEANYDLGVAYLDDRDADGAKQQVKKLEKLGAQDTADQLQKLLVHQLYPNQSSD